MLDVILQRFESPDETRVLSKGRFELIRHSGRTICRASDDVSHHFKAADGYAHRK